MERKMRRGNFLLRHGTAALLILAFSLSFMAVDAANAKRKPVFCTREYAPVCALVQVMCVRAPCPGLTQHTFSNACEARAAGARILYKGHCKPRRTTCHRWKVERICKYSQRSGRIICVKRRLFCLER
jgi:hypothetical protein